MPLSQSASYFRKLHIASFIILLLLLPLYLVIPWPPFKAVAFGYLLGVFYVLSNFWVLRRIDHLDQKKFMKLFFVSLAVRFLLVLSAFVGVLLVIKIDQILFTVSFIISYILHSIAEVIFINKTLENANAN